LSSTQTGLFEKIIKVEYDFPDPEWTNISNEAKDFIRHLLVKDPEERWNAKQCKTHPWLSVSFTKNDINPIREALVQANRLPMVILETR
jgi:serine/threonine protein kinase